MKQQMLALQFLENKEYGALFMDPGLGKTKVVIDEVQNLLPYQVVVVCPKSIASVWAEEISTHGIPNIHGVWVWGKGGFQQVQTGAINWYIINIDAINRTKTGTHEGFNTVAGLLGSGRDMVVIDESTIIKNPDAKRTKAIMDLGKLAKYRRILTGTPMANTPLDVYAQMRFLSSDIFPYSKNFFAFRAKYAVMGGFQMRQVVGYKNQEQLAEIIAKYSFRATQTEWLKELPPRTTQIRNIELSPTTWRAYRALVDELAVEFANTQMSIDMVIKKITKLRQLTGGWLRDDDGNAHPVGSEKLNELKHLLDECTGQKIIIWCQFTHEVFALQQLHPDARVYHGGMNSKARDEARHAFEHGNCPIIIIQNDTGSMGLTLNAATVSIFYSNPIYPLPKEQARARNYRKGQDKPVVEYELMVRGSIDETIYNAIINKITLAEAIMNNKDIKEALIPKARKIDWRSPKKGRD
jgi:SNF2 family DNA or RNA helicase